MSTSLLLFGPPGCGKSTVGKLLAKRLGWVFVDTDEEVEKAEGTTISEIFIEKGEDYFRALEKKAVLNSLALNSTVISVGGGAVINPEVNGAIKASSVVPIYLQVSLAAVSSRVGFDVARPLLAINPRASWSALFEKRRAIYEELAGFTVLTDAFTPEQVVDVIDEQVKSGSFSKGNHQ
jgi:shikimate kinase